MKFKWLLTCLLLLLLIQTAYAWRVQQPLYIIDIDSIGSEFCNELKSLGYQHSYLGGYSSNILIEKIKKYFGGIENSNTIIIVKPSNAENLDRIKQNYPNLIPIAYDEILLYPYPFMYFDSDGKRVRGIIIAEEKIPKSFANYLANNDIPLKTAFWYEDGKIKYVQKLESPWNPKSYVPSGWKSLEGEHFKIVYKERHKKDADLMLRFAESAREVVMKVYPHNISSKITIYLHTLKDYDRSPNIAYTNTQNLEIHFLTPSEQPDKWYDWIWYKKNMIHEYAHIPFYNDLYSKTEGYKTVPEWISEGFAEYCAIFGSNDKIIENKYKYDLNKIQEMVKNEEGYLVFVCKNIYYGGAYIVKYMYEVYGQDKFVKLIKSPEKSFVKAMKKELGVTPREFENNWLKWACKEFDVDTKIYNI